LKSSSGQQFADTLARLSTADHPPRPWASVTQIPWHEDAFSQRMLAVHLDDATHMASRSRPIINQHVDWLLGRLNRTATLPAPPHPNSERRAAAPVVLDIGCGPGLYNHELARRGIASVGFDFAPAPLAWARKTAQEEGLDCRFIHADLTSLPTDFAQMVAPESGTVDAITFWFGEFHSFQPHVVADFLPRLVQCLKPGGLFILEYQPWDIFVQESSSEWEICRQSVFCDEPHLWLQEFAWDEKTKTEVHAHWIIEQKSGILHRYQQCHQAWQDIDLLTALTAAGLSQPEYYEPITGAAEEFEFPILITRKNG